MMGRNICFKGAIWKIISKLSLLLLLIWGWLGGAMVLGKLPVPGRPTILKTVGQGPIALTVGGDGVVLTFLLSSILSPLSPSLWETARYRLKYCLKGPLNPKQPTKPSYLEHCLNRINMVFYL